MADLILERNLSHVIEGLTEATLVFGLLPNNQPEVIGVCWTLGIIFLFYMLFPFMVYLCWNKRKALINFFISIILSLFYSIYFFTDKFVIEGFSARKNFLYCTPWIMGGGIVYLYRNEIKFFVSRYRWGWLAGCVVLDVIWHFIPCKIAGTDTWMLKNLFLYMPWLMYAISVKSSILSNNVTKYLSSISLELYLAQMVIFRVIEKAKCLYLFRKGWTSFLFVWIAVVVGLLVFIEIWKRIWAFIQKKLIGVQR